jgi:hypothetical protein
MSEMLPIEPINLLIDELNPRISSPTLDNARLCEP